MKAIGGRTSKDQDAWLDALTEQGYAVQVCVGFEEAKETIEQYMRLPKQEKG